MMFFVSGITGHVGGAAAKQLLQRGHKLRTLARDPQKAAEWSQQGVDVQQGDFTDSAAVAKALQGVAGAFLMLPPVMTPERNFSEANAIIGSFREALRKSPPPRLVLLSSIGSEKDKGLGLITTTHMMEQALRDLPMPTALVRAGSFIENYLMNLQAAAASGWFDSFMTPTHRAVPMVATADIGAEVAKLLSDGWDGNRKIVELGSRLSPDQIAQAMSEVLGRPVQARAIPREKWSATLQAMGMPAGGTWAFEEMEDGVNSGWIDFGVPGTESVAGTTTAAQVFAQAKKS